jgi:hypothetical protein
MWYSDAHDLAKQIPNINSTISAERRVHYALAWGVRQVIFRLPIVGWLADPQAFANLELTGSVLRAPTGAGSTLMISSW